MNAVVASAGSSRSARAASARVAAATSSIAAPAVHRHEYVHALRPAGLDRAGQAGPGQRLADQVGGADGEGEGVPGRRVDVEHQVGGMVQLTGQGQRRVILHRPLVREPQQRAAVVAQRVGHLTSRCLRPQRHRPHPRRRVLGHVLLHERRLAAEHPDDRQRPVPQDCDDLVSHRVQVVHQIPLGRLRAVEQGLVQVGQRYPVPHLAAAHLATFPLIPQGRETMDDDDPAGAHLQPRLRCVAGPWTGHAATITAVAGLATELKAVADVAGDQAVAPGRAARS